MFRYILFWPLAAWCALVATPASSEPRLANSGARILPMHGHQDGSHRVAAHGRRFGPVWGWPAYALPEQEYPVSVAPPRIDFDQNNYHCDYYDCTYAYHPLGHEPIVDPSPRFYVLAPNAKIISIPEGR
jgi:hypothetical protein